MIARAEPNASSIAALFACVSWRRASWMALYFFVMVPSAATRSSPICSLRSQRSVVCRAWS